MILAFKRVKNFGWVALVAIVLISLYPLSLSVGAVRSDLRQTEYDILRVKKEMRYLETEFATRASMQQLEQWNTLDYGYIAPTAAQYLDGERSLANLGEGHDNIKKPVRVASLTLDGVAPAGIVGSPYGVGADSDPSSQKDAGNAATGEKSGEAAGANSDEDTVLLAQADIPDAAEKPAVATEDKKSAAKQKPGAKLASIIKAEAPKAKKMSPTQLAALKRERFAAKMDINLLTQRPSKPKRGANE